MIKYFVLITLLGLIACNSRRPPDSSIEVAAKGLHSAAIQEGGENVVVGSIYHGGSFWRLSDNERLFNWNHDNNETTTIVAADFSDNGQWVLTAAPHTMVLWNALSGAGERFWTAPAEILDAELDANARFAILALEDHTAVIFDIRRGGIHRVFSHRNRVRSVDLSADGKRAITGSEDYNAMIWDTVSGKETLRITHEDDVQLVKLSDDGQLALSVSKYDKALVWRADNGEKIAEIPLRAQQLKRGLRFTTARFSPDNKFLLTGRPDRIVQLWQLEPIQEVARWTLPKRHAWKPTSAAVLDVSFTKTNNKYVAVGSNGFVHTLSFENAQND